MARASFVTRPTSLTAAVGSSWCDALRLGSLILLGSPSPLSSPSGPTDATSTRRYLFAVNLMPAVLWPHANVLYSAVLLGSAGISAACRRLVVGMATHRVRPTRWMAPRSAGPPATSIMVPDLAASATQPLETAPNAGMPDTCTTCRSQIWTNADLLGPVRESLASGKPIT